MAIVKWVFSANHDPWYSLFTFYLIRLTSFLLKKRKKLYGSSNNKFID